MKNLSAILLAGFMVFGFACTFNAEDALAEANQPFLREVETAKEDTRAWEIGNVQRENSLGELLSEKFITGKDILTLEPAESFTKATLLENEAFPYFFGLLAKVSENQFQSEIVCSGTNMYNFAKCVNGYLEQGYHLHIWLEDDVYYARLMD